MGRRFLRGFADSAVNSGEDSRGDTPRRGQPEPLFPGEDHQMAGLKGFPLFKLFDQGGIGGDCGPKVGIQRLQLAVGLPSDLCTMRTALRASLHGYIFQFCDEAEF